MNILFLSLTFPDQINLERGSYNLSLCSALARRHHVQVVAPRTWYEWLKIRGSGRKYAALAETLSSGLDVEFPVYWYPPRFVPQIRGSALWRSVRAAVKRSSEQRRPDVVVSYWAFPDGDAGLHAARELGIPSIVIVGGSDVLLLPNDPSQGDAVRRVLKQSDAVTTVSDGLRRATIALGVPRRQVQTIRQGVDAARFNPGDQAEARIGLNLRPDAELLLWVGRMVPVKNLDFLVSIVAKLAVSRPRLQLHLIGDGECRGSLEARVASEGLSHVIHFQGVVANDMLPDWYRAANVTVLSSHSEGLPNVLRESLACGTPFVATDVGDVGEFAAPDVSRLVRPGDDDAFTRALVDVLEGGFRRAAANAAASPVRTWADCADEYEQLFHELIRNKATQGSIDQRVMQ